MRFSSEKCFFPLIICCLSLGLGSRTLRGENSAPPAANQSPQQLLDGLKVPTPPNPAGQGRKEKSDAAAGMAIFGAVMAMASCATTMAQARRVTDPNMRALLTSQASQQCAQAAQNAANAQQNKDGSKKLQENKPAEMPNQGQLASAEAPNAPEDELAIDFDPQRSTEQEPIEISELDEPLPEIDTSLPDLPVAERAAVAEAPVEDPIDLGELNLAAAPRTLAPLPKKSLVLEESPPNSNGNSNAGNLDNSTFASSSAGSIGSGGSSSSDLLKELSQTKNGEAHDVGPSQPIAQAKYGSSSSSGTGNSSKSGSGIDFAGLMTQFLGGEEAGGNFAGASGDVVVLPPTPKQSQENSLNIFEYASYRYQRALNEEGRLTQNFNTSTSIRGVAGTSMASAP